MDMLESNPLRNVYNSFFYRKKVLPKVLFVLIWGKIDCSHNVHIVTIITLTLHRPDILHRRSAY